MRAAAVTFILASVLAFVTLLFGASLLAQERTPEWLFDHSHFGEARAVLQKKLAANPRDVEALAWLARVQVVAGDVKGAVASAEKALTLGPTNVLAHLAFAEALGEEAESANLFRQIPMARRIRKSLETAVQLEPSNVIAIGGLVQYYQLAPGVVGGSTTKADQLLAKIAALDPVEGYLRQAWVMSRRKQQDKVEGLYLKALAADPARAAVRLNLAWLYANNAARQSEAETHAKAAIAIDPAYLGPYQVLAIVYARAKRWPELDAILAQSDRHHPANLAAMYSAARVLLTTGADLPRAERYFRRYLSQPPEIGAPSHADAQRHLQQVLHKTGGPTA